MTAYIERVGLVVKDWLRLPPEARPDPKQVPRLLLQFDADVYEATLRMLRDFSPVLLPLAVRAAADNLRVSEADRAWFTAAARALYEAANAEKTP